tara:strand:+ start:247 stop:522 length:276 start_codon:yes stop_codon:yes gene_type:complete
LILDSKKRENKMEEKKISNYKQFEWFGVITAIIYSLFVALNIGLEFFGFLLLLFSAISIGIWAFLNEHKGILLLQFFYTVSALIGLVRWSG